MKRGINPKRISVGVQIARIVILAVVVWYVVTHGLAQYTGMVNELTQ
ncbi:MAG: hypothetical protein HZB16_24510 [Armatimonadetes bacterium]|nr:hypothetical protein [Armatimonadota bacterium]